MRVTLKIILFILLSCYTLAQTQPQLKIQLIFNDWVEDRIVSFGIDPLATDDIDLDLGEANLPPPPPPPIIIDVRFVLPEGNFSGAKSSEWDFRNGTLPYTGQKEHRLKFQSRVDSLKILYELPPEIICDLQDLVGGIVVNTQLIGSGSFTIPNANALGQLKLFVNYNNANDVKLESSLIPNSIELRQNYPNPFNPATTIRFSIKELSDVRLRVFNLLGKEEALLVNEQLQAGSYSVDFDASGLSSGTYFYQLNAGGNIISKKMIFLK